MGQAAQTTNGEMIVGTGEMATAIERLRKVARLDTTVLLTGESGTGKEVVASWLHAEHPKRRNGPLISVHCGAIPETLLESELFGHVRGAFSGAERNRCGVFEQADGGTLLLDEISTMSPQAQVRLLRVLQERRVTRVGSTESIPVDVRVVVASNQNLRKMVDDGTFRLDLFYRINAFSTALPSLRRRRGDVPLLAELFGRRASERMGCGIKRISTSAMNMLCGYTWPGNVRELENAIEHAYILAGENDEIEAGDLPAEITGTVSAQGTDETAAVHVTEDGLSFRTAVTNLERDLILQSLRLTGGNKARAAALLDLKRTTFLEKLQRLEEDGSLLRAS